MLQHISACSYHLSGKLEVSRWALTLCPSGLWANQDSPVCLMLQVLNSEISPPPWFIAGQVLVLIVAGEKGWGPKFPSPIDFSAGANKARRTLVRNSQGGGGFVGEKFPGWGKVLLGGSAGLGRLLHHWPNQQKKETWGGESKMGCLLNWAFNEELTHMNTGGGRWVRNFQLQASGLKIKPHPSVRVGGGRRNKGWEEGGGCLLQSNFPGSPSCNAK